MNIHIENIIADIKRGNKQAFKKLFDDYYPILCVFASHYIEDKEVCKDIAQDVLLAYWERKEDFNDILKVKSFLYTVTRNKCLNYLKHAQLDIPFFHGKEEYDNGFDKAAKQLEYAFDFMESAFAGGQELVVFITELNTSSPAVAFLQEYSCERYYRYNKELLFRENTRDILERIRQLG